MAFLKKLGLALGVISATSSTVQAQDIKSDGWFGYVRHSDGGPWIITINETLIARLDGSGASCFALVYHFKPDQLVNSVMPRPEMAEGYYDLEDRIEAMNLNPSARQAASMVGGGIRKTWYCPADSQLSAAVGQMTQKFEQFQVEVVSSSIAELLKLKPTQLERQLRGDEDIIRNLANQGDDGSASRQIMHWIYNTPPERRPALLNKLKSLGYTIEEDSDEKIRASIISPLSVDSANRATIRFNEICQEFGCEYDGWETAIVAKR